MLLYLLIFFVRYSPDHSARETRPTTKRLLVRYCLVPTLVIALLSTGCAYVVHLDTVEHGDECPLTVVDDSIGKVLLPGWGPWGPRALSIDPPLAEVLTSQLCAADVVRASGEDVIFIVDEVSCWSQEGSNETNARIEGNLKVVDNNIEFRGSSRDQISALTIMTMCEAVLDKAIIDLVHKISVYLNAQHSSVGERKEQATE